MSCYIADELRLLSKLLAYILNVDDNGAESIGYSWLAWCFDNVAFPCDLCAFVSRSL